MFGIQSAPEVLELLEGRRPPACESFDQIRSQASKRLHLYRGGRGRRRLGSLYARDVLVNSIKAVLSSVLVCSSVVFRAFK